MDLNEEWKKTIKELVDERYRPYLNDNAKNEVRNALTIIFNHCQLCNIENEGVDLEKIKKQVNRILETLELGGFLK